MLPIFLSFGRLGYKRTADLFIGAVIHSAIASRSNTETQALNKKRLNKKLYWLNKKRLTSAGNRPEE